MDFSKRYNREEFVKFLQNDFLPEEDYLTEVTQIEIQQETKYIKAITRLGTCHSLELAVYEARHTSTNDARVGLSKEIFRFMANKRVYRALVAFVPEGNDANYRFSLISIDLSETDDGKTKHIYSNPRRYSYYLGENTAIRTPKDYLIKKKRVKDIEDLMGRFHVEQVNDTFFAEYKAQYEKFCKFLCENPEMQKSFQKFCDNSGKAIRDYVKKMLGRIVFLYFVQRKGWLNGDLFYMSHLFSSATDDIKADFLDRVLEPMFFGLLNTDYDKRQANALANGWDLSLIPGYENIPYLNGGLFEQDETDKCRSVFPSDYFKELFEFFDTYNFTVDENAPNDADVGIDPEMLGIIFENLLEDNKEKGVFYTPKNIVAYMCRESLIAYLNTNTNIGEEKLRQFVEAPEDAIADISEDDNHQLLSALRTVRICDPAIGSGAFPMGLLNELLHCREALDDSLGRAELKKDIIQNNIYGVDIEKGAVDIARLRFWLSLVVDETHPQPLPNLDYKIMCGNSLLHRFALDAPFQQVFKDYNQENGTNYTLDDYRQWVYSYTNISDHTKKDAFHKKIEEIKQAFKTELNNKEKGKIAKVRGTIANLKMEDLFGKKKKEVEKKIKVLQKELKTLEQQRAEIESNKIYEQAFEWRFEFPSLLDEEGDFKGFDIVIGNPPYLRIQGIRAVNSDYADELAKDYRSATGSFDLYALFVERGLQIINSTGFVNYIMPIKWTNAAFGKGLRSIISESDAAYKFINFGAYQVFNASTYTALQWFMPNSNGLTYYELDRDLSTNHEIGEFLQSLQSNKASIISHSKLGKNPWTLTVGKNAEIIKLMEQHPRSLGDVFDKIFQGLATSKDDVYFIYDCICNGDTISGFSKQLNRMVAIERGLVKPLLKGEDVHRYDDITTDRFVIFPYKLECGKAILYTEEELATLFPKGCAYLKECEDILRNREKGRLMNDDFWYRYIYPKNLTLFDNEKLVAPEISLGGNFAYDLNGEFYSTTKIYGYIKNDNISESYKFWLGLLNSKLFWFYIQNTGYVLRGGYFTFKTNYVIPFPIPKFNVSSTNLKKYNCCNIS